MYLISLTLVIISSYVYICIKMLYSWSILLWEIFYELIIQHWQAVPSIHRNVFANPCFSGRWCLAQLVSGSYSVLQPPRSQALPADHLLQHFRYRVFRGVRKLVIFWVFFSLHCSQVTLSHAWFADHFARHWATSARSLPVIMWISKTPLLFLFVKFIPFSP